MSAEYAAICDQAGIVRSITPTLAALIGYLPEEIIGQSFRKFIALNSRQRLVHDWARLSTGADWEATVRVTLSVRDGDRLPLLLDVTRLSPNEFLINYQGAVRGRQQIAALNALLGAVSGSLRLSEVLDLILDQALRIVPGDYAVLILARSKAWKTARLRNANGTKAQGFQIDWQQFDNIRRIYETRRPLILNDCLADPNWSIIPGWETIQSGLGVPLRYKGQFRGILVVVSTQRDQFTIADASAALLVAPQAAAAIRHAQLYHAAKARAARLEVISKIGLALSQLDAKQVIQLVAEQVVALVQADVFFLALYDHESETVRYFRAYNRGQWSEQVRAIPLHGLTGYVIQRREAVHIHDSIQESFPVEPVVINPGEVPRTVLMWPLIAHNTLIGVISVQHYAPKHYRRADVRMLETIANQTAVALHNARLYDEANDRLNTLLALQDIGTQLSGRLNQTTILDLTVREIARLLQPQEVRLYLNEQSTPITGNAEAGALCLALAYMREGGLPVRPDPGSRSAVWHVLEHGVPVTIAYSQPMPAIEEFEEVIFSDSPLQLWVGHPIRLGPQVYGVAALFYTDNRRFRAEDGRTLGLLLNQTANALENAHYAADVSGRLSELSALYRVANQIAGKLDLDTILYDVTHTLYRIFPCRMCMIALREPEPNADLLRIRALAGLSMDMVANHELRVGAGLFGKVVQTGLPLYISEPNPLIDAQSPDLSPRSVLIVPLTAHHQIIGALGIDSSAYKAFSPDHERLLTIAAAQIAGAIDSARLYEEIHDRAQRLADANHELEALDRLRTELVQNLSHELRSPLTFVKGYARLLHDGDLGPVTGAQVNALDLIEHKADTITRLIADLMTLETLDSRDLRLTRLDLAQLAAQAADNARVAHYQKHIQFKTVLDVDKLLINGDPDRLNQVFDNLIGNAVKFSPEGGAITVRAWAERGLCLASIADTGIGIPPDKLPYIFERFYQGGDSTRRRFGGAGLGLSIVRRIVEAHGGQVRVESQLGVGSTFIVQLPLLPSTGLLATSAKP